MRYLWLFLAVFFTVGTFLPFSASDHWLIRLFDFPRVQLLVGIGLLLIWGWRFRAWRVAQFLIGALVLSAGILLYRIIPYTPIYPEEVLAATDQDPDRRVRLYSVNVLQDNRDYHRVLDQIADEDPDLVAVLETDGPWIAALAPLRERYPYYREVPIDNFYGLAVYSRLPWRRPRVHELVDKDIPSFFATLELPSKDTFNLYVVHPTPPSPTENPESTERDAELLMVADSVAANDIASVMMGDMNDVAWSHSSRLFKRISGLMDPRIGRGPYNTFSTANWLVRWPLDYIFHTDNFTLHRIDRLPDIGSDHYPIIVELQYQPELEAAQEEPEADQDDREEAARSVDKVQ